MKYAIGLLVALGLGQQTAIADHAKLEASAQQLSVVATQLMTGARQVIGYYPTYRQRYAYEHISFFHNSAHRFEQVLHSSRELYDHAHDQLIVKAYRQLEHDVIEARQTFPNLWAYSNYDHALDARLEQLMKSSEQLVQQIYADLPTL